MTLLARSSLSHSPWGTLASPSRDFDKSTSVAR